MRMLVAAALLFLSACAPPARSGGGTITGTLVGPDNEAVPGAPVQARHVETGTLHKVTTSQAGVYKFEGLPAGTYDITVPAIGFTFLRFEQKALALQEAASLRSDIRLEWGPNLGTPGDDPSIQLRPKYASVSGPAPRTPDGKPDLSGVWLGNDDPNPEQPSMLPWATTLTKERLANSFRDNPSGFCLPSGPILFGPLLFKIVQTPTLLVQLTEDIVSHRQMFLDGRPHPKEFSPSAFGHSVGRWEGDTLVVDTVGYDDKTWLLTGEPHTEMLHVVERYSRPDLTHLQIDVTFEDPGAFTKPYQAHMVWNLAPGEEIYEYVCENNRDAEHLRAR